MHASDDGSAGGDNTSRLFGDASPKSAVSQSRVFFHFMLAPTKCALAPRTDRIDHMYQVDQTDQDRSDRSHR